MTILTELLPGFALTFATSLLVFGLIYYRSGRGRPEFLFTFLVFSFMAYLVSSLLRDVQLTLGFSFGLLAVFTILRYRTEQIPIREMTYMYVSITLPFINSLFVATRISFTELALINGTIVLLLFVLEHAIWLRYTAARTVLYERIELIKPGNHDQLIADLRERTGLHVTRCEVQEIDFLRDTATLTIYYEHPPK